MNTRPQPILIGFFPKKTARPDSWFGETPVEEIGSVSACISKAPDNWIARWKHNTTWWLYDTEESAWSIVGDDPSPYDVYAYKLYPIVFEGETASPIAVDSTAVSNLSDFDFLGYDAVSRRQNGTEFGCSPLSCNRGCDRYRVNRYCLMDNLDEAWRITQEIAKAAKGDNTWEPGPYFLCEVYRKRRTGAGPLVKVSGSFTRADSDNSTFVSPR